MWIKIYNEDCFDILENLKVKVDLFLLDLPYGITNCSWDVCIDVDRMWQLMKKVSKPSTIYIFFCTTKFGVSIINSNPKWFCYDLIWEKSNRVGFLNAKKLPLRVHENIYIFKSKIKKKGEETKKTYNPIMSKGTPYEKKQENTKTTIYGITKKIPLINTGIRYPTSILKFNNPSGKGTKHNTMKPQNILEYLIKTYSNQNDVVCDFCMGSGSTGIACIETNRNFIGAEKDKDIFKMAFNRLIEKEIKHKPFLNDLR